MSVSQAGRNSKRRRRPERMTPAQWGLEMLQQDRVGLDSTCTGGEGGRARKRGMVARCDLFSSFRDKTLKRLLSCYRCLVRCSSQYKNHGTGGNSEKENGQDGGQTRGGEHRRRPRRQEQPAGKIDRDLSSQTPPLQEQEPPSRARTSGLCRCSSAPGSSTPGGSCRC